MKDGMSYDDYNTFRSALAPASGFQSAQFRHIEIYCTRLENLLNDEGKKRINPDAEITEYFENIYWRDAGLNRETGKKTLTLTLFEEKYLNDFIDLARKVKGRTIEDRLMSMSFVSQSLIDKLKEFDNLYNVEWPLVHLNTAQHYLDSKGENKTATGGSEWKKYLHPKFQQRKFFPSLWNEEEKQRWGDKSIISSS
jgi:tryptophan 2,3-dioxygenase